MNPGLKIWLGRIAWLLLATAAGASSWLVIANQATESKKPVAAAAKPRPDYILDAAHIVRYGVTGAPHYILDSKRIVHERVSGESLLDGVALDYYPASAPYWRLSAAQGRLSADGNRALLTGNVRASQPALAVPMELATSRLRLRLSEHRVASDVEVTLRQGARTTRGIGLRADLSRGIVELLHHVASRYAQ